jgi:hypothetical protein
VARAMNRAEQEHHREAGGAPVRTTRLPYRAPDLRSGLTAAPPGRRSALAFRVARMVVICLHAAIGEINQLALTAAVAEANEVALSLTLDLPALERALAVSALSLASPSTAVEVNRGLSGRDYAEERGRTNIRTRLRRLVLVAIAAARSAPRE